MAPAAGLLLPSGHAGNTTGKTLVVVNTPEMMLCANFSVLQASLGAPMPARVRCLSATQSAVHVVREDAKSLLIRPARPFLGEPLDGLYRDPTEPFQLGQEIRYADLSIQVAELGPRGTPAAIRVRFAESLENPALYWITWQGTGFVRFVPPAPGAAIILPPVPLAQAWRE